MNRVISYTTKLTNNIWPLLIRWRWPPTSNCTTTTCRMFMQQTQWPTSFTTLSCRNWSRYLPTTRNTKNRFYNLSFLNYAGTRERIRRSEQNYDQYHPARLRSNVGEGESVFTYYLNPIYLLLIHYQTLYGQINPNNETYTNTTYGRKRTYSKLVENSFVHQHHRE